MFLFVTIAKTGMENLPTMGLNFTSEHIASIIIGCLLTFVLMGLIAPVLAARRIRKEKEREDARAALLKAKDEERAKLLKENDELRAIALKTKDEARKEVDIQWHENVEKNFVEVNKALAKVDTKITGFCQDNNKVHEILFNDRNKLKERMAVIERTCSLKTGCDVLKTVS